MGATTAKATLVHNSFLVELHEGLSEALYWGLELEQASRKGRNAVVAFVDAVDWGNADLVFYVVEELRDSVGDYPAVTAFPWRGAIVMLIHPNGLVDIDGMVKLNAKRPTRAHLEESHGSFLKIAVSRPPQDATKIVNEHCIVVGIGNGPGKRKTNTDDLVAIAMLAEQHAEGKWRLLIAKSGASVGAAIQKRVLTATGVRSNAGLFLCRPQPCRPIKRPRNPSDLLAVYFKQTGQAGSLPKLRARDARFSS